MFGRVLTVSSPSPTRYALRTCGILDHPVKLRLRERFYARRGVHARVIRGDGGEARRQRVELPHATPTTDTMALIE